LEESNPPSRASGHLTYLYCDGVMNHLWSFMLSGYSWEIAEYARSVYMAFDEGEYRHPNDPTDASPEVMYTKPMIAEILAKENRVS
jgi:hypothetical protein